MAKAQRKSTKQIDNLQEKLEQATQEFKTVEEAIMSVVYNLDMTRDYFNSLLEALRKDVARFRADIEKEISAIKESQKIEEQYAYVESLRSRSISGGVVAFVPHEVDHRGHRINLVRELESFGKPNRRSLNDVLVATLCNAVLERRLAY